ncbi:MAG: hypothetical protein WCQ87_03515 [Parabacteroides sp.]
MEEKEKEFKSKREVCEFLKVPTIPKQKWDGKSDFDYGIAIVKRVTGDEELAVCSMKKNISDKVRIIKDFGTIPFTDIIDVYPIPPYMEDDIDNMDFTDEASKEAMEALLQEKRGLIDQGIDKPDEKVYEWGYPAIGNKKEAIAFLKSKSLRGKLPTNDAALKSKLRVMYHEEISKLNK